MRLALTVLLLVPAAAAAASDDGLDPLYRRIAADLRRGKPLVATVHVALCDNRVIWCGRLGDGDRPGRNLYWGGAAGFTAWFDRSPGWRRIFRDQGDGQQVLERVVYRMRVQHPGARWRRLGVTKPFEVLLVGLAHRGVKIDVATRRFIHEVADGRGATLRLADGGTIGYGGNGHLVGYAGHNYLMEAELLGDIAWPRVTRREPLGYFALACLTARYYKTRLSRRGGARALLLTRSLMYPGAFTVDGLLRGVVAGEAQHEVYLRGVERYATIQKRPRPVIRAAFTHDADPRFVRRHGSVPPVTPVAGSSHPDHQISAP